MALATYKCKLDRTDRIFPADATFPGGIRIRPGETVEADLAEPAQDLVLDEAQYDEVVETAMWTPFAE